MLESLGDSDSLSWVKREQLLNKVQELLVDNISGRYNVLNIDE